MDGSAPDNNPFYDGWRLFESFPGNLQPSAPEATFSPPRDVERPPRTSTQIKAHQPDKRKNVSDMHQDRCREERKETDEVCQRSPDMFESVTERQNDTLTETDIQTIVKAIGFMSVSAQHSHYKLSLAPAKVQKRPSSG